MLLSYGHNKKINCQTYKRNWLAFDQENFILDYLDINWDDVLKLENENADETFQHFYDKINSLLDKYAPIRKMTNREIKTKSKPWITTGIRKSIALRDRLFKSFIKASDSNNKDVLHERFKSYRNLIVTLCRRSKANYFSDYFRENSRNIRKIWQGVNSIISVRSSTSSTKSISLNINGHTILFFINF